MTKIPKWIKGILPTYTGSYVVRCCGQEFRDIYYAGLKIWVNTGSVNHPEEVEWDANSFRELGE
jgi:hypothetical protein